MANGKQASSGPAPATTAPETAAEIAAGPSAEPPDEGTARGQATREALVEAGTDLFGRLGYHAASNRALAAAAGVNQALIGYHFGGKEGLYLAVFEHIADSMAERMGPAVAALHGVLEADGEPGREALLEAVLALMDRMSALFASAETGRWAMLLVREQQQPSEAFAHVWERVMSRVLGLLGRLVAALEGRRPEDPEVRFRVLGIVAQPLFFRVARAAALRHLGWEDIGPDELAALQRAVRRNVRAMLTPLPEPPVA